MLISTSQHKYKKQQWDNTAKKTTYQLMLFTSKYKLLKISACLQTAFATETHLTEGQWQEEQENMVKLWMIQAGTHMLFWG
jgi:post-segregation antitoxin (ccd killing protein)